MSAIEVARTFRPDFVLLDIGLPGMDGYEVAAALREDEVLKDAVIIAISGYGQEEDRRRVHAAGFDHHLVKPVDFDSLDLAHRPARIKRAGEGSAGTSQPRGVLSVHLMQSQVELKLKRNFDERSCGPSARMRVATGWYLDWIRKDR